MPGLFSLSVLSVEAQNVYTVTSDNQLASFSVNNFTITRPPSKITGLATGQDVVGLDSRPNTGELYALGYNKTDSSAAIYIIDKMSAMATKVGSASIKLALGDGRKVGFDFNPVVDRIRVVSGNGKNYKLHPVTGAIAATDGSLAYDMADANGTKSTYSC